MPIRLPYTEENYRTAQREYKRTMMNNPRRQSTSGQWQYGTTTQTLLRFSNWYKAKMQNQSVTLQASQNGVISQQVWLR